MVAIPTAIPDVPLTSKFGNLAGSTTGSFSVSDVYKRQASCRANTRHYTGFLPPTDNIADFSLQSDTQYIPYRLSQRILRGTIQFPDSEIISSTSLLHLISQPPDSLNAVSYTHLKTRKNIQILPNQFHIRKKSDVVSTVDIPSSTMAAI